ncbi:SgcJ/EcaC family oxidoreductase [Dyadobacter sp. NIV53]|uniref:SgcJ/EcaC family oxidoreductase n=1 Tax=Dyadobacter sp. NIV53 TaxID=2861765 RepID=UPI001C8803D3|nr:SgcJ/EcaC family oxidoreductase [Dyadobacter sp. NIV53]
MSGHLFAQTRSADEASINKQIDAMIYSWNNHNYDDLKHYTTENTDWVNGVGAWWRGREESQYGHQIYHNTIFKESVLKKTSVAIRFLTDDVALVHLYWHFSAFTNPAGITSGPDDCIASIVYVKQNGKWLMTAGQNVAIVKEALQFDPVKQMPKH